MDEKELLRLINKYLNMTFIDRPTKEERQIIITSKLDTSFEEQIENSCLIIFDYNNEEQAKDFKALKGE